MTQLERLAEFRGDDSNSPLDYERDFGKPLDLATWILRAELKRFADGSRLMMPCEHERTAGALNPERR
jgi:hypothetical protein